MTIVAIQKSNFTSKLYHSIGSYGTSSKKCEAFNLLLESHQNPSAPEREATSYQYLYLIVKNYYTDTILDSKMPYSSPLCRVIFEH